MMPEALNTITAVIAAGGFATRFGGGAPKSLRTVAGKSLLEYTVAEVARVGIGSFIVFNNRPEFDVDLSIAVAPYGSFEIVNDRGVPNTFQLAKQAALAINSQYILFMYGHAPRPFSHLIKLIEMFHTPVVATSVSSTTQLSAVASPCGYLEPPHIIATSILRQTSYVDWKSFLTDPSVDLTFVEADGPGEANLLPELISYANYLDQSQCLAGPNQFLV